MQSNSFETIILWNSLNYRQYVDVLLTLGLMLTEHPVNNHGSLQNSPASQCKDISE